MYFIVFHLLYFLKEVFKNRNTMCVECYWTTSFIPIYAKVVNYKQLEGTHNELPTPPINCVSPTMFHVTLEV